MKSRNLFYAVNGSGQGVLFTSMPERNTHFKVWCGTMNSVYTRLVMLMESEGCLSLPPLTWTDEPVVITLNAEVRP